jgi:hypothetical protein
VNDHPHTSALDAQVDAMLQRVARDREQRCSRLRAAAHSQAHDIVRSGRAEARDNVRKAVGQERSRITVGLRQAEARAELEARRRAQRETETLLQHVWAQIAGILEARWCDPEHRRAWIGAAVLQADVLLSARSWRIEHGEGWLPQEQRELEGLACKRGARTIEWEPVPEIRAGMRVRCEGVCLDATIKGLLAHRASIESTFLAEYLAAADAGHPAHE